MFTCLCNPHSPWHHPEQLASLKDTIVFAYTACSTIIVHTSLRDVWMPSWHEISVQKKITNTPQAARLNKELDRDNTSTSLPIGADTPEQIGYQCCMSTRHYVSNLLRVPLNQIIRANARLMLRRTSVNSEKYQESQTVIVHLDIPCWLWR